jgi:hypothetical protein
MISLTYCVIYKAANLDPGALLKSALHKVFVFTVLANQRKDSFLRGNALLSDMFFPLLMERS